MGTTLEAAEPARQTVRVPRRSQETPTFRRRRLGVRLRDARGERRAADVARALGKGWGESKISRIENGVSVSVPDVRKLLRQYETPRDEADELIKLATLAKQGTWFGDYRSALPRDFGSFAELEQDATAIWHYQETLIPGLLQTQAYAREILHAGRLGADDDELDKRLEARMVRRELFARDVSPRLTFVIAEFALRLPVGDTRTGIEQMQRLLDDARLPNVTLHIVPTSAGPHASIGFPHVIFSLAGVSDVAYAEELYGNRYVEDPDVVAKYRLAFESVLARSLGADASAALIAQVKKERERDQH